MRETMGERENEQERERGLRERGGAACTRGATTPRGPRGLADTLVAPATPRGREGKGEVIVKVVGSFGGGEDDVCGRR